MVDEQCKVKKTTLRHFVKYGIYEMRMARMYYNGSETFAFGMFVHDDRCFNIVVGASSVGVGECEGYGLLDYDLFGGQ